MASGQTRGQTISEVPWSASSTLQIRSSEGYFSNQGASPASTDVAVVPPNFTLGTAPRNLPNVRAPGTDNASLSLFKEISLDKFREGTRLEFRAEAFNALNHPVFSAPNTTVNGGSFGLVESQANSPREVQLALKLYF